MTAMLGRVLAMGVAVVLASIVVACGSANTGYDNLQFSGASEPFPADYQARAQRYLGERAVGAILVSAPQLMVGETALSPRRWYVCLRGLPPPAPKPATLPPVTALAQDLIGAGGPGVYEEVLVLRASGTQSAITGFDAPLCQNARYEGLAAV